MTQWDTFLGPNAGYVQELYERFRDDPDGVDAATRTFFERMGAPPPVTLNGAQAGQATTPAVDIQKVVLAARLARSFREYGHLAAQIDPLGHPGPGDPMIDPATHGLTDED